MQFHTISLLVAQGNVNEATCLIVTFSYCCSTGNCPISAIGFDVLHHKGIKKKETAVFLNLNIQHSSDIAS